MITENSCRTNNRYLESYTADLTTRTHFGNAEFLTFLPFFRRKICNINFRKFYIVFFRFRCCLRFICLGQVLLLQKFLRRNTCIQLGRNILQTIHNVVRLFESLLLRIFELLCICFLQSRFSRAFGLLPVIHDIFNCHLSFNLGIASLFLRQI